MGAIRSTFKTTTLLALGAAVGVFGYRHYVPESLVPSASQAAAIVAQPPALPTKVSVIVEPLPEAPRTPIATRPAVSIAPPPARPPAPHRAVVTDNLLQREKLIKTLEQVKIQLERYSADHHGEWPAFQRYPAWEPLTRTSRADGAVVSAARCGPYLGEAPVNPLSRSSSIGLVKRDVQPGQVMPVGDLGFVFNIINGKLWAVDEDGRTILDER